MSSFIRLVTHTPDLQSYTVYKLYTALRADVSQEALTLAGVWTIGEYGDVLLQGGTTAATSGGEEGDEGGGQATTSEAVGEKDVLDLLERILVSPYTNTTIRQFVLTALAKLSTRFSHPEQLARIATALHGYDASVELELQQRAVEFGTLLRLDAIKGGVLERMPPPEIKATVMGTVSEKRPVGSLRRDKDALLDLMGDEGADGSAPGAAPGGAAMPAAQQQTTHDLLADIFGSGDAAASAGPAQAQAQAPQSAVNDIMSLFGSTSLSPQPTGASSASADLFSSMSTSTPSAPSPAPAPARSPAPTPSAAGPQALEAYNRNGLVITLTAVRDPSNRLVANVLAKFRNASAGGSAISGVNFQAAVPKTQRLQMLAMSRQDVAPGATETQQLRVMVGAAGANVRLRLRIAYVVDGAQHQDQTDFSFPPELMAGP